MNGLNHSRMDQLFSSSPIFNGGLGYPHILVKIVADKFTGFTQKLVIFFNIFIMFFNKLFDF